jgi:hypothetical protein
LKPFFPFRRTGATNGFKIIIHSVHIELSILPRVPLIFVLSRATYCDSLSPPPRPRKIKLIALLFAPNIRILKYWHLRSSLKKVHALISTCVKFILVQLRNFKYFCFAYLVIYFSKAKKHIVKRGNAV